MVLNLLTFIAEGVVLFTFVFLLKSIYEITDLLVAGGTTLSATIQLLFSLLPSIMILTFPMALLMASMLMYGRMTQDNELIALQASGYSTWQLIVPAFIVGLILTVILFWWSNRIAPKGLRFFQNMSAEILKDTATAGIHPGGFNKLGRYIFFPSSIEDGIMYDLRIFEKKDEQVTGIISAPTASLQFSPENNILRVYLQGGTLHQLPEPERDVVIKFDQMLFNMGIPLLLQDLAGMKRTERMVSNDVLQRDIIDKSRNFVEQNPGTPDSRWYYKYWKRGEIEKQQRRALPFACLFMVLIGSLLGMESRFGKRSACYTLTVIIIILYYVLLSFGKAYVEDDKMPAFLGIWIPNIVSLMIFLYLYYRTQRA